jgi:hypothetical protein
LLILFLSVALYLVFSSTEEQVVTAPTGPVTYEHQMKNLALKSTQNKMDLDQHTSQTELIEKNDERLYQLTEEQTYYRRTNGFWGTDSPSKSIDLAWNYSR